MAHEHLGGIVPPMVTPFTADESIDEAAFRGDARHLVHDLNVHGLAVGDGTGEGHALSLDERVTLVGAAVEEACGKAPVIAGIIADSTRDAVAKGKAAAALGLHEKLLGVWNAIEGDNLPATVRHCMELQGRPAGQARAPRPPASERQEAGIAAALRTAGVIGE